MSGIVPNHVLDMSKNMRFSTEWNKRTWISQCFQIQNQKVGPWRMSMQNMENKSWASEVYNNKKGGFERN